MKKAIVVLLVLAFVSAMAFADDAKSVSISGYVEAGAAIVAGSGDAKITQAKNDDHAVKYALSATMGDFAANFEVDYTKWDSGAFALGSANLSYGFLGNMLTLTAGKGAGGVGATANNGWGGSGVDGIGLYVTPITGLQLGAGIKVDYTDALVADAFKTVKIGAAYTMENLVGVALSYLNQNGDGNQEFDAGINVLAVENLTAQVEAQLILSGTTSQAIFENVAYALGDLTVGVSAQETLSSDPFDMWVKPSVSYALGVPTVGASVKYTLKDSVIVPDAYVSFAFNSMANMKLDVSYDTSSSDATIKLLLWSNF